MTFSQITTPPQHYDVAIVGGGPSLLGADLSRLHKRTYVLTVNNACWKLPHAQGCITADVRWAEYYSHRLAHEFAGSKFVVVPEDCELSPVPGITYLKQSTEVGISRDPAVVRVRGSSGYAAINVATLLGAKRIWLLGFDMSAPGTHWFGAYAWKSAADESVYSSWVAEFVRLSHTLAEAGVSVTVVGMASKLVGYPKRDISEFLGWLHDTQHHNANNRA